MDKDEPIVYLKIASISQDRKSGLNFQSKIASYVKLMKLPEWIKTLLPKLNFAETTEDSNHLIVDTKCPIHLHLEKLF